MATTSILSRLRLREDEYNQVDSNFLSEKRALERSFELQLRRLEETAVEDKKQRLEELQKLRKEIEMMSLYDGENLAATLTALLTAYEGVDYHYINDGQGNFIISDDSVKTAQEQQLYTYRLQRDLDKLRHVHSIPRQRKMVYLPPRDYYTNVPYGYDRQISKVQKTIEDFIDFLFSTRVEREAVELSKEDLEQILMTYLSREDVIEEYLARSSERKEELKVFNEIHERSQNIKDIEFPTSYFFKALREVIKRAESDRFEVDHQYTTDDYPIAFKMSVRSRGEVIPYLDTLITIPIGEKNGNNYPKTIAFNTVESHISTLYKYIPRVKKFMENLYSIAILKKKDGIIVLDENDIKDAYDLTIKQKAYALTKVRKPKKEE